MNQPLRLIQSLRLWDVVAMNIVAVVGLRWISRSARLGAPSVTLWILACLVFFVPLAAVLAELSSRHPEQGGIYAWARRAFGPTHGFVCGWCMWVNNLFYFPALLLFGAANATLVFGSGGALIADNRLYSVAFVVGALWFCTLLNIVGFSAGKWLQHIGSVATWIPAALLIGCGAIAFATFGSATSFAPSQLIPREDLWTTLSLWSAMCFAFSGFEISSMVGQEVHEPRRTIPRSIVISGVAITAIYILSSASVLVAVPASELAERSGIADAVDLISGRLGLAGMGAFIGLLLAVGSIGGTSSWVAGAARVPFAAGVDAAIAKAYKAEIDEPPLPPMEEPPDAASPLAKGFRAPIPFRRIKPDYTEIAALFDVAATVEITVDLDAAGTILRTEITRSAGYGLDEAVEKAVRTMNWLAASRDGKPLAMRFLLRYNFKKVDKN